MPSPPPLQAPLSQLEIKMSAGVVIMSRGRIGQIGIPVEIYCTPRNRFVTAFLGSSNLFEGKMEKIVDDRMQARTSGLRAIVR